MVGLTWLPVVCEKCIYFLRKPTTNCIKTLNTCMVLHKFEVIPKINSTIILKPSNHCCFRAYKLWIFCNKGHFHSPQNNTSTIKLTRLKFHHKTPIYTFTISHPSLRVTLRDHLHDFLLCFTPILACHPAWSLAWLPVVWPSTNLVYKPPLAAACWLVQIIGHIT